MKNEVSPFVVSADAKALAKCILNGDSLAADALVDWVLENRNHRGFSVREYTSNLEDCIREVYRIVYTRSTELTDPLERTFKLTKEDLNRIYALIFDCIREAKTLGRVGPA